MFLFLCLTLLKSSPLLPSHVQIHEFHMSSSQGSLPWYAQLDLSITALIYPLTGFIYISIKPFGIISYLNISPLVNQRWLNSALYPGPWTHGQDQSLLPVTPHLSFPSTPSALCWAATGPRSTPSAPSLFFFFWKKETDPEGFCFMDKQPELIWWPRQEELKEQSFDPSANHCSIWPGAMEIHTSSGSQEDPETVKMSHESTELKPKRQPAAGAVPLNFINSTPHTFSTWRK